ncbi:MAG TPA: hypothetical protein VJJ83_04260 [Candidatus Babeliales bacterium]|nr:hypothetical protein [Candidatus Babeliales bacterium]
MHKISSLGLLSTLIIVGGLQAAHCGGAAGRPAHVHYSLDNSGTESISVAGKTCKAPKLTILLVKYTGGRSDSYAISRPSAPSSNCHTSGQCHEVVIDKHADYSARINITTAVHHESFSACREIPCPMLKDLLPVDDVVPALYDSAVVRYWQPLAPKGSAGGTGGTADGAPAVS